MFVGLLHLVQLWYTAGELALDHVVTAVFRLCHQKYDSILVRAPAPGKEVLISAPALGNHQCACSVKGFSISAPALGRRF